jgi:hypothetical protein
MEKKCPKCSSPLNKSFATISGNSKYLNWECEVCNYKEMKCTGIVK